MSIFDDIGNAFEDAGNAIKNTAEDAGNAIADTTVKAGNAIAGAAESTFDFSKKVMAVIGIATLDGVNMYNTGWQDVFNGDFKEGLSNVVVGMCEVVGVLPPDIVQKYDDMVGQATLWSLLQSKDANRQICFSTYLNQVKTNIQNLGLQWDDQMEQNLREGVQQMPWINPGC